MSGASPAPQTLTAFPTPVTSSYWPNHEDLNRDLKTQIAETMEESPGIERSNVGGWHSATDFLSGTSEAVRELCGRIQALLSAINAPLLTDSSRLNDPMLLEGWANVIESGNYASAHCHPNSFWSGVYYLSDNETVAGHPFSGKLELFDPRPGAGISYQEVTNLYGRFLVSPKAGQIVVFPSWLQHCVHPYHGAGRRMSIAFNASFR